MGVKSSHGLHLDRPTTVLFSVLWMAPILTPWVVAGAYSAFPEDATPPQQRAPGPVFEPQKAALARLRLVMTEEKMLSGAAAILQPRLEGRVRAPVVEGHETSLRPRPTNALTTRVLRAATIDNRLRLTSNGVTIALEGVVPLEESATCKRLDGRTEPCVTRIAHRFGLLTQGRTIVCQFRDNSPGDVARGKCRADRIDIADDLLRNGLARRIGL